MGKLKKNDRLRMMTILESRYEEIAALLKNDEMCALCTMYFKPQEIMMKKFRLAFCIKLLHCFMKTEELILNLPDTGDLFLQYDAEEEESHNFGWIDDHEDFAYEWNLIGEMFLEVCLKNTSWNVYYMQHITDYELLEDEIILDMQGIINFHWGAMINANEQYQAEVYIVESQILKEKGCKADSDVDCMPDCNLILTNKNIERLVRLAEEDKSLCSWDEYKEFSKYAKSILFDRYYTAFNSMDISHKRWKYINYFLAEICFSGIEETGLYQLNFEGVLYLVMADMAAEDFLGRYDRERSLERIDSNEV